MTRPRIRATLLGAGAGLATSFASMADFTGVINGYYYGTGAAGPPRTEAVTRQHPASPAELLSPRGSAAPGRPGRPEPVQAGTVVTNVTEIVTALPGSLAIPGSGRLPAALPASGVNADATPPDNGRPWLTRARRGSQVVRTGGVSDD